MQKKLTIVLDQAVYERLCEVVGRNDEHLCSEYIENMVRGTVERGTDRRTENGCETVQPRVTDEEIQARTFLLSIFQSGMLAESLSDENVPEWIKAAHEAMRSGNEWDGSALAILKLGFQEMKADLEREAEAEEWLEGLAGETLPEEEDWDGAR